MKVCFPVQQDNGVDSQVFNHFGSAPMFILVDTSNMETVVLNNNDQHHAHGMCNPVNALGGNKVDAIIVGGIGMGALHKLNSMGIKVFKATLPTINENIGLLRENLLPIFATSHTCKGHGHGRACSH